MRVQPLVLVAATVAYLAGAPSSALAQGSAPKGKWPVASPASVGLNKAVLDSLDAEIAAGKYGFIDRMLVIRHGKVAFDKAYVNDYMKAYGDSAKVKNALNAHDVTGPFNYFNTWWHPYYQRGDLHTLQSVTKTVASAVIGAAVTRGDFPGIDTPVLRFFDTTKVANIDDRKRRMTVRHLMTMTGGIDWNESLPYIDPNNTASGLESSPDWIAFTINRPMMREPGTKFNYSSGESSLLAHVFRQATGTDIEEYAARHLFAPIGITRWFWKRTPSGTADTEGGLYLAAGDLARIWYLFTQDGMWNGTRVVSADWVKQSVTPAIATGTSPNAAQYGLKWWLYRSPVDSTKYVWSGSGFGGQFPMAFPDLDLVVVFNAWNILPRQPGLPLGKVRERLAKAVVGK
ncbi:MAG: serine hydrolase [Gemmatimonadetes bacterium]|nr:serine hydrolase [Gemmatimonadota bacterium]